MAMKYSVCQHIKTIPLIGIGVSFVVMPLKNERMLLCSTCGNKVPQEFRDEPTFEDKLEVHHYQDPLYHNALFSEEVETWDL